jgi:hypothetical protein
MLALRRKKLFARIIPVGVTPAEITRSSYTTITHHIVSAA